MIVRLDGVPSADLAFPSRTHFDFAAGRVRATLGSDAKLEGVGLADWSTVAIAAISALAGMGGSVILGRYSIKALAKTHVRDDAAQFRNEVAALFSDLDMIQEASSRQLPLAMSMANGVAPDKPIEMPHLGKVRAIVALYFPDLQGHLNTLSERETEAIAALRASIQGGENPLVAGGKYALEQSVYMSALCRDLRNALPAKANEIGASVRASIK